jgi:predicted CXXCH cytochrome family protein
MLLVGGPVALVALGAAADYWICLPAGKEHQYVGRQTCAECHQQEHKNWTGSHHDLAMDLANGQTVLGNFDDQEFTHFDVTSKMTREGDRFFITTENKSGQMEKFHIKYVFGVDPLQQYMVEFDDGRVQVLSIAWDTKNKRWFHLYSNERIPAGDWLHWTGAGQNWNYMCAECHSTNLQKNYDLKTDTYHTTFSEIDVSCEECHGPGSTHVELANSKSVFWDRRYGYGLAKLKDKSAKTELETCAKCHSRRRIVHPDYRPGHEFLDHYEPELLDGELYHADGQIRDEVYEYGSFLQSMMYRKGVRCSNCHEPHTAKLRFEGNKLCGQCHTPGKYDSPAHHHHEVGTKGASCVECHMPETTYMVVDPRRDHSIRIPRPDLTSSLGSPNACNRCHDDKSPEWASEKIVGWYGPKRRDDPHYGLTLLAGRTGSLATHGQQRGTLASSQRREEQQQIIERLTALARKKDVGPNVRASAVALLGRYPSPESLESCQQALREPDPQLRTVAVRSTDTLVGIRAADVHGFSQLPPEHAAAVEQQLKQLRDLVGPLLSDPVRAVRSEAARVLSIVPPGMLAEEQKLALDRSLEEYMTGQMATADQAAAHLNRGVVYGNQQKWDEAEQAYLTAIRIESDFVPARMNLAMQYDQQGRKPEAEKLLREVTQLAPQLAEGHYSLGLLLAENEPTLDEATEHLAKAAEIDQENPRMQYNLGLARQRLGDAKGAETALKAAWQLQPESLDFLNALAHLYIEQKQWSKALQCAEAMLRLAPHQPQLQQFHSELKAQADKPKPVGPSLN